MLLRVKKKTDHQLYKLPMEFHLPRNAIAKIKNIHISNNLRSLCDNNPNKALTLFYIERAWRAKVVKSTAVYIE